jgi:hypothetical protein
LIAAAVLISGCGGGESATKSAGQILRDAAHETPALVKRQTVKALDELLSEEAVEEGVASAFCQGVTSLANEGALPEGSDWRDFLISYVEQRLIGVSHTVVEEKVDEFNAAANLSQIDSGTASYYVRGCLARL